MKKILLIHTGGTISMSEDRNTGEVNTNEDHPLRAFAASLNINAEITERIAFNLPSPHIGIEQMSYIAEIINNNLTNYDGFIITHGTDTLEETAFFLKLTINTNKPIIITGAMRSSNELGTDAILNIKNALLVAVNDKSINKGVLVVMNGQIFLAEEVTKTSSRNLDSFKSPFGAIGEIYGDTVQFLREIKSNNYKLFHSSNSKKVFLLKAYAGFDVELLQAVQNLEPDGIVIEAFGQGNLPKAIVQNLIQLIEQAIPVVITSRSYHNIVKPIYAYVGGAKYLENNGAILASNLTGPKARIQLQLALENELGFNEIKELFTK